MFAPESNSLLYPLEAFPFDESCARSPPRRRKSSNHVLLAEAHAKARVARTPGVSPFLVRTRTDRYPGRSVRQSFGRLSSSPDRSPIDKRNAIARPLLRYSLALVLSWDIERPSYVARQARPPNHGHISYLDVAGIRRCWVFPRLGRVRERISPTNRYRKKSKYASSNVMLNPREKLPTRTSSCAVVRSIWAGRWSRANRIKRPIEVRTSDATPGLQGITNLGFKLSNDVISAKLLCG